MLPIYLATLGATLATVLVAYAIVRELLHVHGFEKVKAVKEVKEVVSASVPVTHSDLYTAIKARVHGEVSEDLAERGKYSRDTSVFTKTPELVVYPKDAHDVSALVKVVRDERRKGKTVSVTARSAGTDMSGGPLTDSVVAVFTKHMNHIVEVGDGYAVTEPGVYYRDFEKATLAKKIDGLGQLMPSYPASREICAMGGIVNNDSGGERTLEYGKTHDYVEELDVVLSDGTETTFKALSKNELLAKQKLHSFEGDIYRNLSKLLEDNKETIKNAKPKVSKNSAGYALWDIDVNGRFNLAKLITGAQGTLALVTKARLRLVKEERSRAMLVIFLSDLNVLPEIVRRVLPFNPESFESYDDHTFKLAIRFLPGLLARLGLVRAMRLGFSFLPEVGLVLQGGVPKLVLMAEFSEDTPEDALHVAERARVALADMNLQTRINKNDRASEKYWIIRRESFALLRQHSKGLYAAPFIDDFVVPPDCYPQFLPELNTLLAQYKLIYTIAGHIGNGNFHIIPLMDLSKPETRSVILELSPKVYELVIKYGGTTTGEHNDGIIRTPYLPMLFGTEMVMLFADTKKIFDPENIFNPGKKVGGTFEDIEKNMLRKI
ncbi:MAG: Oxidoreductase [Parcubacteria group bacterium]|nr:Oxidoreductase [Parcubacteria group bacterium]